MKAFAIQRGWHTLATMTQTIFAVTTLMLMSSISWADDEAVLEKCDAPKGTIAVAEPQSHVIMALSRYNLPPPTSLLRQYIQNSNCFQVVERGRAMRNIQQERNLSESGMLQQDSNMGGGQMVTADFVMTPDVIFKDSNAGGAGVGAAVGSLFGGIGSLVGAVAGGVDHLARGGAARGQGVAAGAQVGGRRPGGGWVCGGGSGHDPSRRRMSPHSYITHSSD